MTLKETNRWSIFLSVFFILSPIYIQSQTISVEKSGSSIPSRSITNRHCWNIKTNLLYNAVLIPNIGLEFELPKQWSLGASWLCAWWTNDSRHRYWRLYGGELNFRKYFGRKTAQRPLSGHHLGIYIQGGTYDFELGKRGYLSNFSYGSGLEYGYSLPISRRLNLDFSLGIGYLGGKYKVYDPIDTHYVWKETRNRNWIGPTKAEVSLVWLFGHTNFTKKKGGSR